MDLLNQEFKDENHFNTSIPTDEKEEIVANLKIDAYARILEEIPSHSPTTKNNQEKKN